VLNEHLVDLYSSRYGIVFVNRNTKE
jgi:hypothetical protein